MSRAQAFDGQFWEGGSYEELPTEYAPARPRRHKSARRRGRPEWVVPPAAPEVLDYEEARPVRMGRGRQGGGEAAPRRRVYSASPPRRRHGGDGYSGGHADNGGRGGYIRSRHYDAGEGRNGYHGHREARYADDGHDARHLNSHSVRYPDPSYDARYPPNSHDARHPRDDYNVRYPPNSHDARHPSNSHDPSHHARHPDRRSRQAPPPRARSHGPSKPPPTSHSRGRTAQPPPSSSPPRRNASAPATKRMAQLLAHPLVKAGARTALSAGAQAAINSRSDSGPWLGAKGAKVATAALGAALVDGFMQQKHPGSMRQDIMRQGVAAVMGEAERRAAREGGGAATKGGGSTRRHHAHHHDRY